MGTDNCLAKKCALPETPAAVSPAESDEKATDRRKHFAKAVTCFEIAAPRDAVWQTLTNFDRYPELFKRIKTCKVTKREGDLVFVESFLKSQLFLKQTCQHTVNDLGHKPDQLSWKMLDGNFKSVEGEWKLEPKDGNHTRVTYRIEVEGGPYIPQTLVSMFLKVVQKEATTSVKSAAEAYFTEQKSAEKMTSGNRS